MASRLRVEVETEKYKKNKQIKEYGVIVAFTQGAVGGPRAIIKLDGFEYLIDRYLWDFRIVESDDNIDNGN